MPKTIEVKTGDLEGAALEWAVAIAEGWKPDIPRDGQLKKEWPGGVTQYIVVGENAEMCATWHRYRPSTNWTHGGPLLEKHGISLTDRRKSDGNWYADIHAGQCMTGSTPLEASCRAIVAAKLGDIVQIPSELA
jgi:Protein of unknown function (DUF2591)